jgi:CheY-like chemotaxis protein
MPASMLDRVFDLFVQGDQGMDRSKGGMGVGLALVKRLVELQGGTVAAASGGPGRGARFSVRLPALDAPSQAALAQSEPKSRNRVRVLVVEDNDDARRMLCASLALNGHHVREVRDGASGIELAAQGLEQAVLIDVGLPDMTGYEVARRIRSGVNGSRLVLVALTGYGQPQDRRLSIEAGFDAHLVKPVSIEQIERVLGIVESDPERHGFPALRVVANT